MSDDEKPKDDDAPDSAPDSEDTADADATLSEENGEAAEGGEEAAEDGDGDGDGDGEEESPPGLKAKLVDKFVANKKLAIIIAGILVAVIGGGSGIYFSGFFHVEKTHEITLSLPDPLVYHEVPRITVDLKPSRNHPRPFIRMTIQAELQGQSAVAAFVDNETKILDAMHAHLRDTTVDDLRGEVGTETLRDDLTAIINRIIAPEIAVTVLYKDLLIR